ncbi:MAG TPA: NUDIX hydrolase [Candidatus Saccharimonadales bacterium]|nr:NUDIX hydrolase [Candidatus Saccharimonadales bacterium]
MKKWQREEPTTIINTGYRSFVFKTFKHPDGRVEQFGTFYSENSVDVATIALTKDNKVLVFRQFRPGPETVMDELPGGGAEVNEDVKAAAQRELEEETGYEPGEMQFMGKLCCDAYSNAWRYYFLALNCVPHITGQKLELNEQSGELVKISIDKLIANAKSGKMTDSGAILLAYDTLLKLKEKSKS